VDREAFEHHLLSPAGRDALPPAGFEGVAGGSLCGDTVRFALTTDGRGISGAGFTAAGCGALTASASAAVTLVRGRGILEAARLSVASVGEELGGLSPGKLHAAELVVDAVHSALGAAARAAGALAPSPSRVLVAMSGGVDSAVAALRCAGGGGDVVATTLELWRDPDNDAEASCCSASAVRRARSLAHGMGLPHLTIDLRDEFRAGVVQPFLDGHAAGETPNPCVLCNGFVRLDALVELADRLGAAALATGHYARVTDDGAGPLLRRAADDAKDQTYMLAGLSPATLARLRFPLGDLRKPEVRALAAGAGLAVARTPDSQDLCFLAGTGKREFLAKHGGLAHRAGDIVDEDGVVLGRHDGVQAFTVGQRRGLGLGGGTPLYVLSTDTASDRVVVGPRESLRTSRVAVRDARLHRPSSVVDRVKLRYRSRPLPARAAGDAPSLTVELDEPAYGAAPGQAAVLLSGDVVVGVGTIA
jgi:tRNA-uridine 2-sulfurtransferase